MTPPKVRDYAYDTIIQMYWPISIHSGGTILHFCPCFRFTAIHNGTCTGKPGVKGPMSPCKQIDLVLINMSLYTFLCTLICISFIMGGTVAHRFSVWIFFRPGVAEALSSYSERLNESTSPQTTDILATLHSTMFNFLTYRQQDYHGYRLRLRFDSGILILICITV